MAFRTLVTAIVAVLLAVTSARAVSVNAFLYNNGPDVRLEYSGALDLTGLTAADVDFTAPFSLALVAPSTPDTGGISFQTAFNVYEEGVTLQIYQVFDGEGPEAFGTGTLSQVLGAIPFGDSFGLTNVGTSIGTRVTQFEVPEGYATNDPLAGGAVLPGTDLATLGATPGRYLWSFGNNSVELTVGAASAVPLPASVLLLLGGLGALGAVRVRAARRG